MNKYTFLILNLIFYAPIIVLLFVRKRKEIKKYKKLIFYAALFGFFGYFLVEPLAVFWGAWGYDYSKTLGIKIGGSVIENLMWAVLLAPVVALTVAIWSDREKKKKPLWPFI